MIPFLLGMASGIALILILHFRKTILPEWDDIIHPAHALKEAWAEVKEFLGF